MYMCAHNIVFLLTTLWQYLQELQMYKPDEKKMKNNNFLIRSCCFSLRFFSVVKDCCVVCVFKVCCGVGILVLLLASRKGIWGW